MRLLQGSALACRALASPGASPGSHWCVQKRHRPPRSHVVLWRPRIPPRGAELSMGRLAALQHPPCPAVPVLAAHGGGCRADPSPSPCTPGWGGTPRPREAWGPQPDVTWGPCQRRLGAGPLGAAGLIGASPEIRHHPRGFPGPRALAVSLASGFARDMPLTEPLYPLCKRLFLPLTLEWQKPACAGCCVVITSPASASNLQLVKCCCSADWCWVTPRLH